MVPCVLNGWPYVLSCQVALALRLMMRVMASPHRPGESMRLAQRFGSSACAAHLKYDRAGRRWIHPPTGMDRHWSRLGSSPQAVADRFTFEP